MAKNVYKGMTVELDGNVSDFSRALRDAKKEAKGTTSELRELKKALKFDPENAELLAKTQENYRKQIQATEKELDVLKKKKKQVRESGEEVSDEAWTKLQNDIQRVSTKLEKLKHEQSDLDFSGPLETSRKAIANAEKDLARLNKSLKLDPTNTELLTTKQEALERAIEASAKQAETLRKKAAQIGKENMSTQEWVNLQADISDCEAKAKDFEAELKDVVRLMETEPRLFIHTGDDIKNAAGEVQNGVGWLEGSVEKVIDDIEDEFDEMGDAAEDAGRRVGDSMIDAGEKIQNGFGKIQRAGDAYTRSITLPMVAAATATVKTAVDIDTALTDVRKTVDATDEEYQALKQTAIDFSKVNAVDASEILSLEALGAQLGFAKDELANFAEVASGLDIATNMDAETAATEMAHFKNMVGDTEFEMERYASTIVELGNHTATTESDISHMAQRIAAAGKQVGMSNADILGMAAALSSLGIEAEAGGTAISTIMSNIDADVARGGDKLITWAQTAGMAADEFAAKWKDSPVDALSAVLQGMNDAVDQGGNITLMLDELGISAIRQTGVLKSLANSGNLMSDTIALANKGWQEQSALTKEVENRNNSLASKFTMLKNRVVAVADDVGGPLCDALLDAIDAAEPLFKAIEKGAKTFSNMSKEEQQMILKAAGAVAALGPLLSIVGRIGGVAGGAIKALGNVSNALSGIGKGTAVATEAIGATSKVATAATGALSGLQAGLIGLAAVAAIAVAAFAIEQWQEYQKELKNTADAAMTVADIERQAATATEDYRKSIEETTQKSKELIEAQAESNRTMADSLKDLNSSTGIAEHYLDIITDLTGKTSLNREEQEKLKLAVDGYNEATGASLEIIDAERGLLNQSTDALIANRDAWIKNQKVKIYEEKYNEALKQQLEAEEELKTATDDLTKANQEYKDVLAEHQLNPWKDMTSEINDAAAKVAEAEANVDRLNGVIANSKQQMDGCLSSIDETNRAWDEQQAALQRTRDVINRYGNDTIAKLAETGTSVDDLSGRLTANGLKAEDMERISKGAFDRLLTYCGGDINKLIAMIREYNNQNMDEKVAEVGADPTDYNNTIWDIQAQQIRKTIDIQGDFSNLSSQIKSFFASGSVSVSGPARASGGYFRNADILNSIPKHANGGILDGATLTSVGWVGEAGAEAIIPLTNKKYMEPFAKAVAGYLPSGGDTYLVIDGAVVNANSAIKQQFLDLFADIYRIGGMNRG